jgi:hypothetical protein
MWRGYWMRTRWWFFAFLILLLAQSLTDIVTFTGGASDTPAIAGISFRPFAQRLQEIVRLSDTFKGFEWVHFFRDNLPELVTLFAVLLGAAGVIPRRSGRLFTLSLPVSREQLLMAFAVTCVCELAALTLTAALSVPLFALLAGQSFPIADALVYALNSFVGGAVFFFVALLFSAIFKNWTRRAGAAIAIAVGNLIFVELFPVPGAYTPVGLMSGESYFRGGSLQLPALAAWLLVAAALFIVEVRSLEQRDF